MGRGRRLSPTAYGYYVQWKKKKLPQRVAKILASAESSSFYDDDNVFQDLQQAYTQWWPDYGFDSCSMWLRGLERSGDLLKRAEFSAPGLKVFEVGCGDGLTGYLLNCYGDVVTINDIEDWREERAKSLPFIQGNICEGLPIESNIFDLVLSYNGFEHISDPTSALTEFVRICKPGGHIYINFSPLYSSPLGLHAWSFNMPYPQFLFSSAFIQKQIERLGVSDLGRTSTCLQPTNKWRLNQFRELWKTEKCTVVFLDEDTDKRFLNVIENFPLAFRGCGLTLEDVVTNTITVLLQKKSI
jgi:ubiquinone/menaquinone biosynthesis C-methylase UbiE